jgi:hypothetical protein
LTNVRFAPLAKVGHGTHDGQSYRLRSKFPGYIAVQFGGVVPANSFHVDVDVDVARGRRTVVHVIGVLVHIEH